MKDIKHSIIVITYNQEELLPICLDSILKDTVLPYEIIIGDDCSTDSTWNVILEYQKRYPEIIKPVRTQTNLGIFGNWNSLMPMVNGDIISLIAGDDFFKAGMLEELNKEIIKNNLNPLEEKFILITNTIELHVDGKEVIYDNYQLRNSNIFKSRIRYGISYREVGLSRKLYDQLDPIPENLGYHADWLYIIDQVYKSDQFFFINKAFSVYRLGAGVTSSTKINDLIRSKLKVIEIIKEKYKSALDEKDLLFLKYWGARHKYLLNKTTSNYLNLFYLQVLNIGNFTPNNTFNRNARLLISGPLRGIKNLFVD